MLLLLSNPFFQRWCFDLSKQQLEENWSLMLILLNCVLQFVSTTSSSADEKENEEQYFTQELPKQPCFEWKKLRKTQIKRRFQTLNWTVVMAKGIRSVHPHCSFAFKHHTVQIIGSTRNSPLFSCLGYCLFDDCPVEVEVKVQDESSLKAFVTFRGDSVAPLWTTEKTARAGERDGIADALTTKLPRNLYLEKLDKLEDSVVESGCRDQVPTNRCNENAVME